MLPDPLIEALRREAASLAALIARSPLDLNVPSCPGWTITDLAHHTGQVHRWAAVIVSTGSQTASNEDESGPDPVEALPGWLLDGANRLADTLEASPPDQYCWTFGFPPEKAGFWRRRQLIETAIHRLDAAEAAGHPTSLPTEVAEHTLDEVIDFHYGRQVALGRTSRLDYRVEFLADDAGKNWMLDNSHERCVRIRGPLALLALLPWRRINLNDQRFRVDGDPDDIDTLRNARLTP